MIKQFHLFKELHLLQMRPSHFCHLREIAIFTRETILKVTWFPINGVLLEREVLF